MVWYIESFIPKAYCSSVSGDEKQKNLKSLIKLTFEKILWCDLPSVVKKSMV